MRRQLTSRAWPLLARHKRWICVLVCAAAYCSFACLKTAKPAPTEVRAENTQLARSDELIEATRKDDLTQIQKLLNAGVDPNSADANGYTPLMIAALRGADKVVQTLLDAHANVNALDKDGSTALSMAIQRRHSTTVGILLNEGADVTFKYADKRTALHYAIEIRDNIVVAMLLDRSADVNARNDHGETPLLLSLRRDPAIVDALIARGADVNAADVDGWTPLMEAAGGNNLRVVKLLLEHGADAKARDKDGWTAHKQALLSGCDGIIAQIAQAAAL